MLRQAEDGAVFGGVAETFDRYVLTLQDLAGPCRFKRERMQGLVPICVEGDRFCAMLLCEAMLT